MNRTLNYMLGGAFAFALIVSAGCAGISGAKAEQAGGQIAQSVEHAVPIDKLPPEVQAEIAREKKFNFCNAMLDAEADMAYDETGVKKLVGTERHCPENVELGKTIEYVDGVLKSAFDDPYTQVIDPEQFKNMKERMAGTAVAFKGGGIGLNFHMDKSKSVEFTDDELTAKGVDPKVFDEIDPDTGKKNERPRKFFFTGQIYHVIKNGAAAKAGIRDGDVVTQVNGKDVIGLPSDDIINTMRGDEGTNVTLTVKRGNTTFKRTLTRIKVLPDNVWSRDLGGGIYAIIISQFREDTIASIMNERSRIGNKARGFVVDVRDNPGGILEQGVFASAFFVHDGVIVTQRQRIAGDPNNPKYSKLVWKRVGDNVVVERVDDQTGAVLRSAKVTFTFTKTDEKTGKSVTEKTDKLPFLGDKPTVVLANDHSASAAEIFTGAVSENRIDATTGSKVKPQGGTFIGVKTFGKFIGQTVMQGPMKTAIKATTFRYFSPKGEWLGDANHNRTGLTPDIEVKQPDNAVPYTATDAQLNAAVKFLKNGGHH